MTLAGSWIARGLRHGASAFDSSRPSPVSVIVSVRSTPPAGPTAGEVAVSTMRRG